MKKALSIHVKKILLLNALVVALIFIESVVLKTDYRQCLQLVIIGITLSTIFYLCFAFLKRIQPAETITGWFPLLSAEIGLAVLIVTSFVLLGKTLSIPWWTDYRLITIPIIISMVVGTLVGVLGAFYKK